MSLHFWGWVVLWKTPRVHFLLLTPGTGRGVSDQARDNPLNVSHSWLSRLSLVWNKAKSPGKNRAPREAQSCRVYSLSARAVTRISVLNLLLNRVQADQGLG